MITLTRKMKKPSGNGPSGQTIRASIRDRLLVKEIQELEQNLPNTCKIYHSDPDVLSEFTLTITPDEGFWKDGKYKFSVNVPEEYNMTVSVLYYFGICLSNLFVWFFDFGIAS